MDTFHQARCGGLATPDASVWELQLVLVEHVAKVWNEPDEGIWEVRGPRQRFTYSRVMAWVAVDRAIKSAEDVRPARPGRGWRDLRAEIHADVWAKGYRLAAATASRRPMASRRWTPACCCWPRSASSSPTDPRIVGTVEAIERELLRRRLRAALRHRQATDDGLPPGEGAFLACSFWLADAYAMIGRQMTRGACSSGCWPSATTWACWRRNTIRGPSGSPATFPRPFRISA